MEYKEFDVVVIGAGPAGTAASLRAADLGAKTALISRSAFGGMAANEGPIPVRTLAQAARLLREARKLPSYGIAVTEPSIDYPRLIARAGASVAGARAHSTLLEQSVKAGVAIFEDAGTARFTDPQTIESERGPALRAARSIICSGGISRSLDVPGAALTVTPAAAFLLKEVPKSLIVVGAGATGAQVASIFNAFGSRITLCQTGPRIVPTEDADVSSEVARAFREDWIDVRERFAEILRFEPTPGGVRMIVRQDSNDIALEAEYAVCAVGWVADTTGLNLAASGVRTNARGFVEVDDTLRTSADHIFAAGDVLGRSMLVPQAVRDGFIAGNNAVGRSRITVPAGAEPIGSFTDPEYAKVGLTEEEARARHDVLISSAAYEETTRPIVDGRTRGFCKLVIDRSTMLLLGCHIVGERAVEVAQMAAIAMTAGLRVDDLAKIPISFPTYANVLGRAALRAVRLHAGNVYIE
ncbi:MAG TPA: NAD(P)/FAD-dependent oxidoreductase [Candidatus Cybelea sp.]|nr:NAD(P)/FAD-dependent oxidoreductase [Candidatus Cybelea sp.]